MDITVESGASPRVKFIAKQFAVKLLLAIVDDHSADKVLYQNPELIVERLIAADPTDSRGTYLTWLVKMYFTKQFMMEDLEDVKRNLRDFHLIKPTIPIEDRDINKIPTFRIFYELLMLHQGRLNKRQIEIGINIKDLTIDTDYTFVVTGDNFYIILLMTHKAAVYFGHQDGEELWCTAKESPQNWESTHSRGELYVIVTQDVKSGKEVRFQMHVESDQMHNSNNVKINEDEIDYLSEFPEWKIFLDMMVDKHYDFSNIPDAAKLPQLKNESVA